MSFVGRALPLVALSSLALGLFGCGGGGGGGSAPESISFSQASISLTRYELQRGVYPPQNYSLHVSFTGQGLLIGFAPGVSPPPWLGLSGGTFTSASNQFDVPITLTPPVNTGHYATSIRFVTGNLDGSNLSFRDLPVSIDVLPLPLVYSGSVAFNSGSTDLTPPPPQTLTLNFGGASTWSATFENTNTGLTNWITPSRVGATDQLSVGASVVPPIGRYEGDIVIDFQKDGIAGQYRIPLSHTVTAVKPVARFVAPAAGYANEAGTLIIRGNGFTTAAFQDIRIGGVSATAFSVVNDTQIEAQYAAFGAAGSMTVELVTAATTYTAGMPFLVRSRPTAVAADFTLPSGVLRAVFDPTRDAIIVSTEAGTLYRLQLAAGAWAIQNQRALSWDRFDITPDARHLVSTSGNTVSVVDAETLADVEAYTVPFSSPPQALSSALRHMTNSGAALLTTLETNFLVFNYVNKTFKRSGVSASAALARIRHDRSDILIVANTTLFGPTFRGFYLSSTDAFAAVPGTDSYAANRVSYSGNGQRLLLISPSNVDTVYDRSFTALGAPVQPSPLPFNYSLELSVDGGTGFRIDVDTGTVFKYDLTAAPPYPAAGTRTFAPFSYYAAFPDTQVTPDGSMMIISGGAVNGVSSERQPRVVIVPLQ